MSDVGASPDQPKAPDPPSPAPLPSDRLVTPQTLVAFYAMSIVAGIVFMTLKTGGDAAQSQLLMMASTITGAILGYYYGSSKGSSDKDMAPGRPGASPPAPPIVLVPPNPYPGLPLAANTVATEANAQAIQEAADASQVPAGPQAPARTGP